MKFTESDIKNINQLFEDPHNAGYVLNFSNKSMREFFESELSIDIDNDIYRKDGDSKMKRLRCLLKQDDRETVLRVVTRLWEHRKTIPDNVITAQDDAVYGRLISKIQGADSLAAAGKAPALIIPTGIDNNYFLKGLETLHNQPPHQRGHSFELWLNELLKIRRVAGTGNLYIKIDEIYPNISK